MLPFCSKSGSFPEAIDDERNGKATLLKSKVKLEQKDQSKRAKKIDGDSKSKVCLDQSSNSHDDLSTVAYPDIIDFKQVSVAWLIGVFYAFQ